MFILALLEQIEDHTGYAGWLAGWLRLILLYEVYET